MKLLHPFTVKKTSVLWLKTLIEKKIILFIRTFSVLVGKKLLNGQSLYKYLFYPNNFEIKCLIVSHCLYGV